MLKREDRFNNLFSYLEKARDDKTQSITELLDLVADLKDKVKQDGHIILTENQILNDANLNLLLSIGYLRPIKKIPNGYTTNIIPKAEKDFVEKINNQNFVISRQRNRKDEKQKYTFKVKNISENKSQNVNNKQVQVELHITNKETELVTLYYLTLELGKSYTEQKNAVDNISNKIKDILTEYYELIPVKYILKIPRIATIPTVNPAQFIAMSLTQEDISINSVETICLSNKENGTRFTQFYKNNKIISNKVETIKYDEVKLHSKNDTIIVYEEIIENQTTCLPIKTIQLIRDLFEKSKVTYPMHNNPESIEYYPSFLMGLNFSNNIFSKLSVIVKDDTINFKLDKIKMKFNIKDKSVIFYKGNKKVQEFTVNTLMEFSSIFGWEIGLVINYAFAKYISENKKVKCETLKGHFI